MANVLVVGAVLATLGVVFSSQYKSFFRDQRTAEMRTIRYDMESRIMSHLYRRDSCTNTLSSSGVTTIPDTISTEISINSGIKNIYGDSLFEVNSVYDGLRIEQIELTGDSVAGYILVTQLAVDNPSAVFGQINYEINTPLNIVRDGEDFISCTAGISDLDRDAFTLACSSLGGLYDSAGTPDDYGDDTCQLASLMLPPPYSNISLESFELVSTRYLYEYMQQIMDERYLNLYNPNVLNPGDSTITTETITLDRLDFNADVTINAQANKLDDDLSPSYDQAIDGQKVLNAREIVHLFSSTIDKANKDLVISALLDYFEGQSPPAFDQFVQDVLENIFVDAALPAHHDGSLPKYRPLAGPDGVHGSPPTVNDAGYPIGYRWRHSGTTYINVGNEPGYAAWVINPTTLEYLIGEINCQTNGMPTNCLYDATRRKLGFPVTGVTQNGVCTSNTVQPLGFLGLSAIGTIRRLDCARTTDTTWGVSN